MRALVREVSPSLPRALMRHAPSAPIDLGAARAEHAAYVAALERLGVQVIALAPLPDHPDACFVEDIAVVADGVGLVTRPGHPSRRGEVDSVVGPLAGLVPIARMDAGTLDGGDVLAVGRRLYVGRSARTDDAGIAALARAFPSRQVVPVPLRDGLHLKSGVTALPDGALVVAPARVDPDLFDAPVLRVADGEDDACNVLCVGATALMSAGFPRTRDALVAAGARAGFVVAEVDNRELRKADSALTCLSVLVP